MGRLNQDHPFHAGYRPAPSDNTGLALFGHEGNGVWKGVWTYANGREVGSERWLPR